MNTNYQTIANPGLRSSGTTFTLPTGSSRSIAIEQPMQNVDALKAETLNQRNAIEGGVEKVRIEDAGGGGVIFQDALGSER